MNSTKTEENSSSEIREKSVNLPSDAKIKLEKPRTLAELFLLTDRKNPRPSALNSKKNGKWVSISSAEMIERIENVALGLHSLGIRRGDRAAILAGNSPDWTITDAGCQFAGIIDVPIYTTLAQNAVEYILNDSGSRILFLENLECYQKLSEIIPRCQTVEKVVLFSNEEAEDENVITLAELENTGANHKAENPNLIGELIKAVEPRDVATLIYTSGTTGEPKGVMLTQSNIISNVITASEEHEVSEKDIPMSVLPLSHVFERGAMYLYIYNGMSVFYAESIDKAAENLAEIKPTLFVGVPRIFEKVYHKAKNKAAQESRSKELIFDWAINVAKDYAYRISHDIKIPRLLAVKHNIADRLVFSKFRAFFGGRLRACITGGAALSDEIFYIFTGAGIRIFQGYGLTETSPVITSNTPQNIRAGTVGKPIPNVQIRLAEDGEIEAAGPNVMLGYFNKPEATKEAFTTDGWFKTGDIGEIDSDGYLKITDRKKELFKTSGGKYIAPAHIEQIIKGSQYVNQVVLIGSERKFPAALIVPDFEALASYAKHKHIHAKTPEEFCQNPQILNLFERKVAKHTKDLSGYEQPKKIALLEKELTVEGGELTPTLKVKRRVVDEKYKEVIEKLYADSEVQMTKP